ncbi:MAG: capsular polysaccharide biosynthesis protein [Phycisphaerae bacterium]
MPTSQTLGRFDVHTHLLPGVDDGCSCLEESLDCARLLAAHGYRRLMCTPHVWPGFPLNTWPNIRSWTAALQAAFRDAGLPLTIYPGGEINIQAMWPVLQHWGPADVPTCAAAGRHVLADFWADRLPAEVESSLGHLQDLGLTVILAHPERIAAFQRDPSLMDHLAGRGVLFQGNLQCFQDPPGSPQRTCVERFASQGRYFLLGSDCHGLDTLGSRLAGLQAAIELLGRPVVDQLTIHNPASLLDGGS